MVLWQDIEWRIELRRNRLFCGKICHQLRPLWRYQILSRIVGIKMYLQTTKRILSRRVNYYFKHNDWTYFMTPMKRQYHLSAWLQGKILLEYVRRKKIGDPPMIDKPEANE